MRGGLEASVARALEGLAAPARDAAAGAQPALAAFLELLLEENTRTNLVSARSAEPDALARHLADVLSGAPFLPPPRTTPVRLLDVGSGGGLPAIPLLLVRRDVEGTLVESVGKKCAFLRAAAARLALTLAVVNARFPGSFDMTTHGSYDVLTTRAVGTAGRLVRAARPVLAGGARALLWTTEPLVREAVRESRAGAWVFHADRASRQRGLLVLEGCGGTGERST